MKKRISVLYLFVICCILLIGCSDKLSEKKETFEGQGITYQFKLPAKWNKIESFKDTINKNAVFGAEDTNSNSTMFIMTYLKSTVELKDFASKTRVELQKRYNYKELEGVYMKEYEINKHKAIKYTLNTTYKQQDVWAHFYYVETEHGFVELIFYSANDGSYEKRSLIIDESVDTLVETKSTKNSETTDSTENTDESNLEVKNDRLTFTMDGVMTLIEDDKSKKLVLRYQLTNLSDEQLIPKEVQSYITATQNGTKLEPTEISDASQDLDLKELIQAGEKTIAKEEKIESVWVFSLLDSSNVTLTFDQDQFKDQNPQLVDLTK
ncbi:DUF5067 domain-containing protein [Enterococcus plantarum]|uniref:DUF5067 domain-containing protein n=1 Tax=Enterococcus plantarum TaxID=1077675 RepID=UPI001A8DE25F|nr:DUF5067 domain-containing protein [Enterococcus plantarum]MBO0466148.1 DUF5067 domain-containing protein [Enterococcus plantarum]